MLNAAHEAGPRDDTPPPSSVKTASIPERPQKMVVVAVDALVTAKQRCVRGALVTAPMGTATDVLIEAFLSLSAPMGTATDVDVFEALDRMTFASKHLGAELTQSEKKLRWSTGAIRNRAVNMDAYNTTNELFVCRVPHRRSNFVSHQMQTSQVVICLVP